jgi:hypothetical protein
MYKALGIIPSTKGKKEKEREGGGRKEGGKEGEREKERKEGRKEGRKIVGSQTRHIESGTLRMRQATLFGGPQGDPASAKGRDGLCSEFEAPFSGLSPSLSFDPLNVSSKAQIQEV